MTLRKKTFFMTAAVMGVIIFAFFLVVSYFLLQNVEREERRDAVRDVDRVLDIFNYEAEEVSTKVLDWSRWDDTYQFVYDRNERYVESNFGPETIRNLKLNFVVIVDLEGRIAFLQSVDGEMGAPADVPDDLIGQLGLGTTLTTHRDAQSLKSGILMLSTGPAFVAARPIVPTDGSWPSRGTIVFGRYIDDAFIASREALVHAKIEYVTYTDPNISADYRVAQEKLGGDEQVAVIPMSEDMQYGYGRVDDLFGSPALVLRIALPRVLHMGATHAVWVFGIGVLGLGIISLLAIVFFLEKFVLRRLFYLGEQVTQIAADGVWKDVSIYLPGNDELTDLAMKVNGMVNALVTLRAKGDAVEQRFAVIAREAPILIWMSDQEMKIVYYNEQWTKLTGKPIEELLGDRWMENIHPGDLEGVENTFRAAFDSRMSFHVECRIRNTNEGYSWMSFDGVPAYSSMGVFLGYVGVGFDITERKSNEIAQEEKRHEAERINDIMVARELKMIELKNRIRELEGERKEKSKRSTKKNRRRDYAETRNADEGRCVRLERRPRISDQHRG